MLLPLFSGDQVSTHFRIADVLDVGFVALVLYVLLSWLRRRAPRPLLAGIAALALVYGLSRLLNMYLTLRIFEAGLAAILVALVIIFQLDIRRGFERLSAWRPTGTGQAAPALSATANVLLEATSSLAGDKIGALVVLEGNESVDSHVRGGVAVDGALSVPLLLSIFHPASVGHDGAVVIQRGRLSRLGVHLPLTANLAAVGERGTRHAAALGLTERCDALVIVVSEERGTVSVAEGAALSTIEGASELERRIERFFERARPVRTARSRGRCLSRNAALKGAALVLAIGLWFAFASRIAPIQRTFLVPIEQRNLPAGWLVEDPQQTEARVTLSGPERQFDFDPDTLVISLDLAHVREGRQVFSIDDDDMVVPPLLSVRQIEPRRIGLRVHRLTRVELPIQPQLWGALPAGYEVYRVAVEPERVSALIWRGRLGRVSRLHTAGIDLSAIAADALVRRELVVKRELIVPEAVSFPTGQSPRSVTVRIQLRESTAQKAPH